MENPIREDHLLFLSQHAEHVQKKKNGNFVDMDDDDFDDVSLCFTCKSSFPEGLHEVLMSGCPYHWHAVGCFQLMQAGFKQITLTEQVYSRFQEAVSALKNTVGMPGEAVQQALMKDALKGTAEPYVDPIAIRKAQRSVVAKLQSVPSLDGLWARENAKVQRAKKAEEKEGFPSEAINLHDFTGKGAANLQEEGLKEYGQLILMTETEFLRLYGVGRTALRKVEGRLRQNGYRFGMVLPDYTPPTD